MHRRPLFDVYIDEQEIKPVHETGSKGVDVEGTVPIQSVGMDAAKPFLLKSPKARAAGNDLYSRMQAWGSVKSGFAVQVVRRAIS